MLAICTDSLKGYGLNRIFELVKEAGYDGIDLNINPTLYDTHNADYIKSLIDQYQFPVLAISTPPINNPKKILGAVKMAQQLNTRIVVIQPPKTFDFKYISWLKKEIPNIRQKEEISIALENSPSAKFLGVIPEHALNNLADLKNFKHVCLDTTRLKAKNYELIETYDRLKKFLVHVHLSNIKGSKLYYTPMKGILPVESFLTKLKQDGFPGTISLKVDPQYLALDDEKKLLKNLQEMKEFYDTYFTQIDTISKKETKE